MDFFKKLQVFVFPLLIVTLCVFLSFKNYQPDTFLLGWDSLHSEFNIKESLYRSFWGVWREDQGLGALAIHSHMADLPRIITIWALSFIFPLNLLRYTFIFLTIILGPLGVYYLINYLLNKKYQFIFSIPAFLASLFYLLNLGTLQHMFVPFEMFNSLFAFLPWLFLLIIKFLNKGSKKTLLLFGLFTILSSPMAYAATLFYAYLGGLLVFLFIFNLLEHKKIVFKRSFSMVVVSILLNLYWILPNIYSITNSGINVSNAKINILFSSEASIRNQDYGDFKDVSINKSFLFDWRAYNFEAGRFEDLMSTWNSLLNSPWVLNIFYTFFAISLMGLSFSVVKLDKVGLSLFGMGLFSLFFLLNLNGPAGSLYGYFANNFEIFKEGLRTPFTKFSIQYILVMSYFFGYFFNSLFKILKNKRVKILLALIILIGVSFTFIISLKPAYKGNFIGDIVKKDIPIEYFDMFNWFNSNETGRVAQLPLNTPWGWDYYSWGYQGSGFIGFGIENPLLIRDFDRWSPYNETFYNQASEALYNNDNQVFRDVLEKYQVRYLLLDESIINPSGDQDYLRIDDIKNTLSSLGINEVVKFGFLTVYDTDIKINSFIRAIDTYSLIDTDLTYSSKDLVYEKYGDYVQNKDGIGYPFANFDPRGLVDIEVNNDKLLFINKTTNSLVELPTEGKVTETFAFDRGFNEAFNCDLQKGGEVERTQLLNGRNYKATNGGVSCDYFSYIDLPYNKAYVLRVKGNNITGRSLKIYLYNWETKRVELEELLNEGEFDKYFVVYPKNSIESGYTLNIETRSFGRISSENEVNLIEIIPFDMDLVSNLYIDAKTDIKKIGNLEVLEVNKYGTAIYKVKTKGSGLLVLDQGFENGWLGFNKIDNGWYKLEHVKVNSWANGFIINNIISSNDQATNMETIIIFWPQLLEWVGFMILVVTLLCIVLLDKKDTF